MMRFKSLELINYIGIANGLGTDRIFIDFTKCKHRVVVLIGDNGAGKSTIFQALTVLQNTSNMFIPDKEVVKVVEVIDEETGFEYRIRYEHTPNKLKGYSTKGYIHKTVDGHTINMNEQGNITACKDIIFSELNLDANFISLSQLSADDKGLASKTPAERKKFASTIIESLEVYNNIHKTISKRSSTFKSMINATNTKIDRLGDSTLLESSLISINNRIQIMNDKKNADIEALGSQKTVLMQMDPNGSIRDTYNTINNSMSGMVANLSAIESQITIMARKIGNTSRITKDEYMSINKQIIELQSQISNKESEVTRMISEREVEGSQLQSKIARLNSLNNETNHITMKSMISDYEEKITEYEKFFNQMGLNDFSLTKDEYIIGLNTLNDIKEIVDVFKDNFDYDIMQIALSEFIPNSLYPDRDTIIDCIDGLEEYNTQCKEKLMYYNGQLQVASKLNMKPNDCTMYGCEFIKDAVAASSEEPEKNIDHLESEITATESLILSKNTELAYATSITNCINYFKTLFRNIDSYSSILKKLPNGDVFSDKDKFVSKLLSGSTFNEINDIYPYITKASLVEDYNNIVKALVPLKNELKIYESKNDLIDEIQSDISMLNSRVNLISDKILSSNDMLFKLRMELDQCTSKELAMKTLLALYDSRDSLNLDISTSHENLKSIENAINSIQNALTQIELINDRIKRMDTEISNLQNDKSTIEHSIRLLKEYNEDLALYKAKYEKIETVKFYSSYNTGIQTVFMELYMYNVNKIANQLMGNVLNGRFHLKDWVIGENEFRIPCLGDGGYLNDDISSLSGGELAIVSMIISFSLLYQASSKYNILKLDEVDGTLDTGNRRQFILVLENLMDILHAVQTIIISHSDEIDLDSADIILLRVMDSNKYNEVRNVGNVIFDYREVV